MDQEEPYAVPVSTYAKMRNLQPQLVYYYIRKGDIEHFPCDCCGSKVVSIVQADFIFKKEDKP